MSSRKCIGILREVKNKWERRVALSPSVVRSLTDKGVKVIVQPSDLRIYRDIEYENAGALVKDDLSEANTIFGVKEFPHQQLIPDRSYILFSHVIKAQPYNMPFLDACLDKRIRLFDYETIRSSSGQRLVYFGRFAGMAGLIDTMRGIGERLLSLGYSSPFAGVSSSYMYPSLEAAKQALLSVGKEISEYGVPAAISPMTFIFTGTGNVSQGAQEIFNLLPHEWVTVEQLQQLHLHPERYDNKKLYGCIVSSEHMVQHQSSSAFGQQKFNKKHYYDHPDEYQPIFHQQIAPFMSVLVNGMYWDRRFPRLITNHK